MSSTSTHYENAELFRTLAERLPELLPEQARPEQVTLLHELADDQIEQAEYDEWVRQKVALARADPHPGWTIEEAKAQLRAHLERRKSA